MNQSELDRQLFSQRPVPPEALHRLKELCTDDLCDKIECIALKAALAIIDELI